MFLIFGKVLPAIRKELKAIALSSFVIHLYNASSDYWR